MKPKPAPRFLRGAGFPYAGAALSRRFLLLLLQSLQIIRRSRFLQPEPSRSQKKEKVATNDDEDRLGVPPTLFPKFMPMLRRSLSRFLSPKRRRKFINRRARGWVALFKRFMFSSKFMASAPPKPPDPPPAPPTPPQRPRPLRSRFNRPAGP